MGRAAAAALIAVLITAASLTLTAHQASPGSEVKIFSMVDPGGDDRGYGTYVYPTGKAFTQGALDLRSFTVIDAGSEIEFIVNLSSLGKNTLNLPNGFTAQNIQIYVHASEGAGAVRTYGLHLTIRWVDRWQFAAIATGLTPNAEAFEEGKASTALVFWNGTVSDELSVKASGNAVVVSIPKAAVKEWVTNLKHWRYFVAITPFNPKEPYGVMSFGVKASDSSVGGCSAEAVKAGVQPQVMDILAPNASAQASMLMTYDPRGGTYAEVAAVPYLKGFSIPSPPETVTHTVTHTAVRTETFTKYIYGTTTVTKPVFHEYYGTYTWLLLGTVFTLLILLAYSMQRGRAR